MEVSDQPSLQGETGGGLGGPQSLSGPYTDSSGRPDIPTEISGLRPEYSSNTIIEKHCAKTLDTQSIHII